MLFNLLVIWILSADVILSLDIPGQPNHSRSLGSIREEMPVATPPTLSLYLKLPFCLDMLTGSRFDMIINLDIIISYI